MLYAKIKEECLFANQRICAENLLKLTWGNVSVVDREQGVFAIKPSGVAYDSLTLEDICIVSLSDLSVVQGQLKPSSDTPTHAVLYNAFESIGSIVHVHSTHAVAFTQAERSLPCYGTTHADHFCGEIPLTRPLLPDEMTEGYEAACGEVLVEAVGSDEHAHKIPAAFLRQHGPFVWGGEAKDALENAIVLEECSRIAVAMLSINPNACPIPEALQNFHYERKHGTKRYYGQ